MTRPHSRSPFSCVLLGAESLLIQCGEILLEAGHAVRAVGSRDERIQAWCREKEIPVVRPGAELEASLVTLDFDYLFSITNLEVIPKEVLALARERAINFHDGPLPRYAGMYAPAWALLRGESEYGVSFHEMTPEIDEGQIYVQRVFDIEPGETSLTLNARCYEAGIDAFTELVEQLASGAPAPQPQNRAERSYFGRAERPQGLGVLDWRRPADELERLVRALDFGPYGNAFCAAKILQGSRVCLPGRSAIRPGDGEPGTVLEIGPEALVVATGQGSLALADFRTVAGSPLTVPEAAAHLGVRPGEALPSLEPELGRFLDARTEALVRGETFWLRRLRRLEPIGLPSARAGSQPRDAFASLALDVPAAFVDRFENGGGPAVLSGFAAHLSRSSGRSRFDLAYSDESTSASRGELLSRWVPLRIEVEAEEPAHAAIERVERAISRARERGPYLSDLVARYPELAGRPELLHPTLGSVAVALRDDPESFVCEPGTDVVLVVEPGGHRARIFHERAVVTPDAARALRDQLRTFLKAVADDAEVPIGRVPLLEPAERRRVHEEWNATALEHDRTRCVHDLIEEQAARTPNAVAFRCEGESLSYGELLERSGRLASHLQSLGVGPEVLVGIHLDRSIDMGVAVLAVLRAGGAYVPLDPSYPGDRLAHMVEDSRVRVILTREQHAGDLAPGAASVVSVDGDASRISKQVSGLPPGDATSSNLAYVIYTSGSTGAPKGVMVEHRNVVSFFAGMDERIPRDPPGVWLAVTSLSFDISVLELLWTLARGFEVVIQRDREGSAEPVGKGPQAPWRPLDFGIAMWGSDADSRGYELMLESARFGDEHGFSSFHTPERHFGEFGGSYPNPSVTSAAVAAVTSRIKIRASSCVLPLHHPLRVAEEWAVVDNLSGGRAEIAFASGWQPNDFVLRPENHGDAKGKMFEGADLVRRLWRGEPVEFENPLGNRVPTLTQPRPMQAELNAWITAAGNVETFELAGAGGYNVLTHLLGQSLEETADKIAVYRRARKDAGYDPETGRVTLMLHTFVGDDDEQVRELVREPMKAYLASAVSLVMGFAWTFPAFERPGGPDTKPEDVDLSTLSEEEVDTILEFAFERYYETSGLFGTPELCAEMVERVRGADVDEICCLVEFGLPKEHVLTGLKALDQVRREAATRRSDAVVAECAARDDFSLATQIERHGVTHLQCTPSMAQILVVDPDTRGSLARVENLMIGGEAFPVALAQELGRGEGSRLTNMYGPTETTIWSSTEPVPDSPDSISLGRPIANTRLYVLDARQQLLPVGSPGELVIGGEGVTRGYLNRPELTREKFVPDPFSEEPGARLYRTGDLARWAPDGRVEFLGRMDQQVKIRGHRIELGEIEARLAQQKGVRECVVVAREGAAGLDLVAYLVSEAPRDAATLKEALRETLPEFMIPASFVELERLPTTPNGKLDRKALPAPDSAGRRVRAPLVAPRGAVEEMLAEIWREVLCVESVGVDDNFFDLGGHSLLIVQAHRKLREAWPSPVSLTDLYRCPTVRSLADLLRSEGGSAGSAGSGDRGQARGEKRRQAMGRRRRRRPQRQEQE